MTARDVELIDRHRALPLRPRWRGLLLDVGVFACLGALAVYLLGIPVSMRRWRRARRTRCVRCAYVLTGIDATTCPECGWTVGARLPWISSSRLAMAAALLALVVVADASMAWFLIARGGGALPIHRAAAANDVEALRRQLDLGVSPDVGIENDALAQFEMLTPLIIAVTRDHVECVRVLLEAGAAVDGTAVLVKPIHLAVENGSPACLRALVEAGADATEVLTTAIESSNVECVEVVLDAGALDAMPELRPFAFVNWTTAPDALIDLLLAAGADLDGILHHGSTALIEQVYLRDHDAVRRILDAGADPCLVDAKGLTALDHARHAQPLGTSGNVYPRNGRDDALVSMLEQAIAER